MNKVIHALKKISSIVIANTGDVCKADLVILAYAAGLPDNQIHENFPEFFREEVIVVEEDAIQEEGILSTEDEIDLLVDKDESDEVIEEDYSDSEADKVDKAFEASKE